MSSNEAAEELLTSLGVRSLNQGGEPILVLSAEAAAELAARCTGGAGVVMDRGIVYGGQYHRRVPDPLPRRFDVHHRAGGVAFSLRAADGRNGVFAVGYGPLRD